MSHTLSPGIRRSVPRILALTAALVLLFAFSVSAYAQTAYDAIPHPQPYNLDSYGYQSISTHEMGDHVALTPGTGRELESVRVLLANWACETGSGTTCVTTPGATFTHPFTIKFYAAPATAGALHPGALLFEKTETFAIPYRPTSDPTCPAGSQPAGATWRAADDKCYTGLATPITFDFSSSSETLPDDFVYSIVYSTNNYGPDSGSLGSGPYDSLNIGVSYDVSTGGADPLPDGVYWHTNNLSWYSDGGSPDPNTFRLDTGWTNVTLAVAFETSVLPANWVVGPGTPGTALCGGSTVAVTHNTISAAVAAAAPGDTIYVCDGTYIESVNLGAKDLTIIGESRNGVVIGSTATSGYGLQGTGNVTLANFTFVGPNALAPSSSGLYGIKLFDATGAKSATLTNVTALNSARSNIDINGYANVALTNVTARNAKWGMGIALTDPGSTTLNGITTSGNAWGGVALYTKRADSPTLVSNFTLAGSINLAEPIPLQVEFDRSGTDYWSAKGLNLNDKLPWVVSAYNSGGATSNVWIFTATEADADEVVTLNTAKYGNSSEPMLVDPAGGAEKIHIIGDNSLDTISAMIAAASAGDTILVGSGEFVENIALNKYVHVIGIGSGTLADSTVIKPSVASTEVIGVSASGTSTNPLLLRSMRVLPTGSDGVELYDVSNVKLQDVHIVGDGIADDHNGQPGPREICLFVNDGADVDGLTIVDSAFEDCDYGWFIANETAVACQSQGTFTNITVSDTLFSGNSFKGMYVEKMSNAVFSDILVTNNGWSGNVANARYNAGIDINLKWDDYANIAFNDIFVLRNALGFAEGMGIGIKARDDGSTYSACPATLTNVDITGGSILGNERGLRLGEPQASTNAVNLGPTDVNISGVSIYGNKALFATNPVLTATPSTFPPSLAGDLVNFTEAPVTAEGNLWGPAHDPSVIVGATGAGAISSASPLAAPSYAFDLSTPTFRSLYSTPAAGTLYVPLQLDADEFATDISDIIFQMSYDACLVYSGFNNLQPGVSAFVDASAGSLNYSGSGYAGTSPLNPVGVLHGGMIGVFAFNAAGCADNAELSFAFSNVSCGSVGGMYDNMCATSVGGTATIDINNTPVDIKIDDATANPAGITAQFSTAQPPLTSVGTLSSTDADDATNTGFARIYSLELNAACGLATAAHHNLFTVSDNMLHAVRTFTGADVGPYSVCVKANDQRGGVAWQQITISLDRDAPDSIALSPATVAENAVAGVLIGTLTSAGDADDTTFDYTLVSVDTGPLTNFQVIGDKLHVGSTVPPVGVYNVTIRSHGTNDPAGLYLEYVVQVTVVDAAELSVPSAAPHYNVVRHAHNLPVTINFKQGGEVATEVDFTLNYNASCLTYVSHAVDANVSGSAVGGGGTVVFDLADVDAGTNPVATVTFTALAGCGDPLYQLTQLTFSAATIGVAPAVTQPGNVLSTPGDVHIIDDAVRGDCNTSGAVNAGDLSATVLEIFDSNVLGDDTGNGPLGFLTAPKSHFVGNPYGCDSNATGAVLVADVSCTTRIIFGETCSDAGNVNPATAAAAMLEVPVLAVTAGEPVQLPIAFVSGGNAIASVSFKLQLDPTQVAFDGTDADKDGMPDAVAMHVAAPLQAMSLYNAADNTLQVVVFGFANPLPVIHDGVLGTVTLAGVQSGASTVSILEANAGDVYGQDAQLDINIGGAVSSQRSFFLPLIQ